MRKKQFNAFLERLFGGTETQHLDMYEGPDENLRGDALLHTPPSEPEEDPEHPTLEIDQMLGKFHMDLSEESREGDEMSGDGHSSGLQGGERESLNQHHEQYGMPGEESEEQEIQYDERLKKRAA